MGQPHSDRQLTAEAAGALRSRLREDGWRSDVGWSAVGSRAAAHAQADSRRTIAYVPTIRQADGGAPRLWKEGDVPVPPEADAREVLVARADDAEWHSEVLEAPPALVATAPETDDAVMASATAAAPTPAHHA